MDGGDTTPAPVPVPGAVVGFPVAPGVAATVAGAELEEGAAVKDTAGAAEEEEDKGCFFLLDLAFLRPVPLLLSPALLSTTAIASPLPAPPPTLLLLLLLPSTAELLVLAAAPALAAAAALRARNADVEVLRRFAPVSLVADAPSVTDDDEG